MVALALAALVASPYAQHWSFKQGATPQVSVSNVSGLVEVRGGDGEEISVDARSSDAKGDWTVDAREEEGRVRIEVRCDKRGASSGCEGAPIDLTVRVPAGAELSAANVSGKIRVEGVTGRLSLSNVSGDTDARGSEGAVKLNTVSGALHLAPRTMAKTSVNTVSGDLSLEVPRGGGARVRLSTVSGEIAGAGEGDSTERRIGDGKVAIAVSSVSASVRLK